MASSPRPRRKSWRVVSGLERHLGVIWTVWGLSDCERKDEVKEGDVAPVSGLASSTVVPMAELEKEE